MGVTLGKLLGWLFRSAPREQNAPPSVASKVNPLSDSTTMMGAGTSDPGGAPDTVSLTSGLKPVTESLWELYSPAEDKIEADIILFHGLPVGDSKNAYYETWLSTDRTVIWPKEWLKKKCPGARVRSVSYDSSARKTEGKDPLDMYTLGENLVSDIILEAECGQEPWRPVILVGHCLGGIIVKQFILSAIRMKNQWSDETQVEKINNFLNNFKGVYFYATPHQGSDEIERWASNLKDPSPILDLLRRLSIKTQRINEEFRQHRSIIKAKAFAVCETQKTDAVGFKGIVVEEASARHDIDNFYSDTRADHFSICRASNAEYSTVIGKLAMFTNDILKAEKKAKEADQDRRLESLRNFQQFPHRNGPRSAAYHTTG